MVVVVSKLIASFRQRNVGIREETSFLIDAFGVQAHREALRRKLDANSFSAARYWSRIGTEAARWARRGQVSFVFDAARDEQCRARRLAEAIEAARFDMAGQAPGHACEAFGPVERHAVPFFSRRPQTMPKPKRLEPRAARRSEEARILAFPKR
jgi:hypothetical protein